MVAAQPDSLPTSASDQLWQNVPADLTETYHVMGVAVTIATNDRSVASLVEYAFGRWRTHAVAQPVGEVEVRILVHDAPEPAGPPAEPIYRVQRDIFMLVMGSSFAFADRSAGFACSFVTPGLLADRRFVQVAILECLVLYLVTKFRPATLHAAAVVSGGRCALLAGGSGAGKSTLAYGCARNGFMVGSDDCVRVDWSGDPDPSPVTPSPLYAWSNPWFIHLRPDVARFFPELRSIEPTLTLSGELKLQVEIDQFWSGSSLPRAEIHSTLLLERSPGTRSRIDPADPREIENALTPSIGRREDLEPIQRGAKLAAGCHPGRLIIGDDLDEAVAVVRDWLEAGD